MKEGENFLPQKDPAQLELPLELYEKMGKVLDIYINELPYNDRNQLIQAKWIEIKSKKFTDEEVRVMLKESNQEGWKSNPAFYYALILEARDRELLI